MPSSITLLTSRSVTRETTAASVVFNISLAGDIAELQYIFRRIGIYTPGRPNSIGPPVPPRRRRHADGDTGQAFVLVRSYQKTDMNVLIQSHRGGFRRGA